MNSMYDDKEIEEVPTVETLESLFGNIQFICEDKRTHILKVDCEAWLEYKIKAILKLLEKNKHFLNEKLDNT